MTRARPEIIGKIATWKELRSPRVPLCVIPSGLGELERTVCYEVIMRRGPILSVDPFAGSVTVGLSSAIDPHCPKHEEWQIKNLCEWHLERAHSQASCGWPGYSAP